MMVLSFWTSTTINILHNSSVQIITFKLEKIIILLNWRKNIEGKERGNQQHGQSALLEDTNYDLTSNELRNVLNGFLLKLRDISSNYILNCSIHSRLSSYQVVFFFIKYFFKNPSFQLPQNVPWSEEVARLAPAQA